MGTLQLIPELGFFLGFFPVLLAFAIGGPVSGGVLALTYVGSVKISSALVETRVSRGVLDVHPGLLIPAIGVGPAQPVRDPSGRLAAAPVVESSATSCATRMPGSPIPPVPPVSCPARR